MPHITDPSFVYVPAAKTDIRRTFRKHGFVGPEEKRLQDTANTMTAIEKLVSGYEVVTLSNHRAGD